MADKVPSLSDAIRASVPAMIRRSLAWWEKIDPAALAELESIRDDWRTGRLQGSKSALARAIVEQLTSRGISDVGTQGVTTWLGSKG